MNIIFTSLMFASLMITLALFLAYCILSDTQSSFARWAYRKLRKQNGENYKGTRRIEKVK